MVLNEVLWNYIYTNFLAPATLVSIKTISLSKNGKQFFVSSPPIAFVFLGTSNYDNNKKKLRKRQKTFLTRVYRKATDLYKHALLPFVADELETIFDKKGYLLSHRDWFDIIVGTKIDVCIDGRTKFLYQLSYRLKPEHYNLRHIKFLLKLCKKYVDFEYEIIPEIIR